MLPSYCGLRVRLFEAHRVAGAAGVPGGDHKLEGIVSGSGKSEGAVVVGGVGIGGGILTKGGADVGAIDGELRDWY